jgi:hypothetical protein
MSLYTITKKKKKPSISHREHFSVCIYTCITVIDKVLLRKEVRQKGTRLGNQAQTSNQFLATNKLATNNAICLKTKKINKSKMYF